MREVTEVATVEIIVGTSVMVAEVRLFDGCGKDRASVVLAEADEESNAPTLVEVDVLDDITEVLVIVVLDADSDNGVEEEGVLDDNKGLLVAVTLAAIMVCEVETDERVGIGVGKDCVLSAGGLVNER